MDIASIYASTRDIEQERVAWRLEGKRLASKTWTSAWPPTRDCYYVGYRGPEGIKGCEHEPVTPDLLIANYNGSLKVKGHEAIVYPPAQWETADGSYCAYSLWDYDNHADDPKARAANFESMRLCCCFLISLGIVPLVIDSDGNGGWHVIILWLREEDNLLPLLHGHAFGQWVNEQTKFKVEYFPKQKSLNGNPGNGARLWCEHPKRGHVPRVYDVLGDRLLIGTDAAKFIWDYATQDTSHIPDEAKTFIAVDGKKPATRTFTPEVENQLIAESVKRVKAVLDRNGVSYLDRGMTPVRDGLAYIMYLDCPFTHASATNGIRHRAIIIRSDGIGSTCFHESCRGRGWTHVVKEFTEDPYERAALVARTINAPEAGVISGDDIVAKLRPQEWAERFSKKFLRLEGLPTFLHYDGADYLYEDGWRRIGDGDLSAHVCRWLEGETKSQEKPQAVERLLSTVCTSIRANHHCRESPEDCFLTLRAGAYTITTAKDLLVFTNGTLNPFTGEWTPKTPALFDTSCREIAYEPKAAAPAYLSMLLSLFDDNAEKRDAYLRFHADCLMPQLHHQVVHNLYGVPRSGKSMALIVAKYLAGRPKTLFAENQSLAGSFGFESAVGKRLIVIPDADTNLDGSVVHTIKSISGRDPINVNRKGKSFLELMLDARVIVASNNLLKFRDTSGAMEQRLRVIEFTRSFAEHPDLTLEGKLISELAGIVNLLVPYIKKVRDEGFPATEDTKVVTLEQQKQNNNVLSFREQLTGGDDYFVKRSDVYEAYVLWCRKHGYRYEPNNVFARRLFSALRLPSEESRKDPRRRMGGDQVRIYERVMLSRELINLLKEDERRKSQFTYSDRYQYLEDQLAGKFNDVTEDDNKPWYM